MNATHVCRIAWKDYVRLRGFWIALIVLWSAAWLFYLQSQLDPNAGIFVIEVLGSIFITTAFYAIGWAGLTFAAEHEENTFPFLRTLPTQARSIFWGKLLHGTLSSLVLALFLVVIGVCLSSGRQVRWDSDPWSEAQLLLGFMAIPLAISWGVWWSMVIPYPLRAIGLTAGTVTLSLYLALAIAVLLTTSVAEEPNVRNPTAFLFIAICLLGAASVLYWGRRRVERWFPMEPATLVARASRMLATSRGSSWKAVLGRLVWLKWKQGWAFQMAALVVGLCLLLGSHRNPPFVVLTLCVVLFLGLQSCRAEQVGQQYRLLGQLGTRAGSYWLATSWLPGLVALLLSALAAVVVQVEAGEPGAWLPVFCFGVALFGIGQAATLGTRSLVLAIAVSFAVVLPLTLWMTICYIARLPWWLSVVPFALLPTVAVWVRLPAWFRDTPRWSDWWRPGVVWLLLAVGVPGLTAIWRIVEIPRVTPPVFADATSEAENTGAAYASLLTQLVSQHREVSGTTREVLDGAALQPQQWMDDDGLLQKIDQLTRRDACIFPDAIDMRDNRHFLAAMLVADAARQSAAGQHDQAWERYQAALRFARQCNDGHSGIYGALTGFEIEQAVLPQLVPWSMAKGNTPERVDQAASWLESFRRAQRPWAHVLEGEYASTTDVIDGTEPYYSSSEISAAGMQLIRRFAPWEAVRAERMRDRITDTASRSLATIQANGQVVSQHEQVYRPPTLYPMFVGMWPSFAQAAGEAEQQRRGTIYQLVAIAYHQREGRYPRSFANLPINNQMDLPLSYFDQGLMAIQTVLDALGRERSYVVSAPHRLHPGVPQTTAGYRPFLLPDFDAWNAELYATYLNQPILWDSPDEMIVEEEVFYAESMLDALPPDTVYQVLADAVKKVIDQGSVAEKKTLIEGLVFGAQASRHFISELAELWRDPDPGVAATAARAILAAVGDDFELAEIHDEVDFSVGPDGVLGLPIRNAENGHYYEFVEAETEEAMRWESANRAAKQRRFQGRAGHLVTITSAGEQDFLVRGFGDRGGVWWTGAGNDGRPGQWLWMCGPEAGTVFYRDGRWSREQTEDAVEYAAWQDGAFDDYPAGKQFVIWNTPFGEQPGQWMPVSDIATAYQVRIDGYLVEYSAPNLSAGDSAAEATEETPDSVVTEGNSEPAVAEETPDSAATEGNSEPAVAEETPNSAATEENSEPAVTEETPDSAATEENSEPAVTEETPDSAATEGNSEPAVIDDAQADEPAPAESEPR